MQIGRSYTLGMMSNVSAHGTRAFGTARLHTPRSVAGAAEFRAARCCRRASQVRGQRLWSDTLYYRTGVTGVLDIAPVHVRC